MCFLMASYGICCILFVSSLSIVSLSYNDNINKILFYCYGAHISVHIAGIFICDIIAIKTSMRMLLVLALFSTRCRQRS